MTTIVFNGDKTFIVLNFNRNANFTGTTVSQNGYATIILEDVDALYGLADGTITSIQIFYNEEKIYESTGLSGKITSISENLNGDRVNADVNFVFE